MAVLFNDGVRAGASGATGDTGYQIAKSLRFNYADSPYLNRTPSSSTNNQRRFTLSFWTKISGEGTEGGASWFNCGATSSTTGNFQIYVESGKFVVLGHSGLYSASTPLFRDPSAWYHIVVAVDTTQSTAADRIKVYVNNTRITNWSTAGWPTQNHEFLVNTNTNHEISSNRSAAGAQYYYYDGYMAEWYLIDGQTLDPSSFGETNSTTGEWVAKEFSGTYSIAEVDGSSSPHVLVAATPGVEDDVRYINSNPDSSAYPTIHHNGLDNATVKVKFDSAVTGVTSIKFQGGGYAGGSTYTLKVNGTQVGGTHSTVSGWAEDSHTISSTDITSIEITGSDGFALGQLKFNNSLVSGTPSYGTLSVPGTNSCYLKFDGTDIGEDSSGKDNDWTANNLKAASTTLNVPCVIFDGTNDYLEIPDSTDFDFGTGDFTIECFAKANPPASTGYYSLVHKADSGASYAGSTWWWALYAQTSGTSLGYMYFYDGSTYKVLQGSALPNNKWHHIAVVRDGDTARLYHNGTQVDSISVSGWTMNTCSNAVRIGTDGGGNYDMNGAISNVRIVNGTCLYPDGTTFTVPPRPLVKVSNTKLLCCQSSSTTADDNSDSDHTITASGDAAAGTVSDYVLDDDVSTDSPTSFDDDGNGTGNYCTWNSIDNALTLSQGNLVATQGSAAHERVYGTFGMKTGKWYWEVTKHDTASSSSTSLALGVANSEYNYKGWTDNNMHFAYLQGAATYYDKGSTPTATSSGDIPGGSEHAAGTWMMAFDFDNGKGWVGKDGVWLKPGGTGGNPATGADPIFTNFVDGATYLPIVHVYAACSVTGNFGQRAFKHTPPSGFKALNSYNLSTTIADPSKQFDTVLTTATSTNPRTITTPGEWDPGLVWHKMRSADGSHYLWDKVRTFGDNAVKSNSTAAEGDASAYYTMADATNGFSIQQDGVGNEVNYNGNTYVSWMWNAGSTNTNSTGVGSIDSTYRANPDAGFSIVSYTGNGTNGATVAHGLNAVPNMVIVKSRSAAYEWPVYHSSLTAGNNLFLHLTNQQNSVSSTVTAGGVGAVSSTTFTCTQGTGNINNTNANTATYIAYCWSEVEGYSKFGQYYGSGTTDGPFVYCGFKPRWIMIKHTNGAYSWNIHDTERNPENDGNTAKLYPNTIDDELDDSEGQLDILSNGFKLKGNWNINNVAETYIFAAFAEVPFKYANAR